MIAFVGTGVAIALLMLSAAAEAAVERRQFLAGGNYVVIEVLDDDLIHVEYGRGAGPGTAAPLAHSEMVCSPADGVPAGLCDAYGGPDSFSTPSPAVLETADVRVQVDPATLALTLIDKTKNDVVLTTVRPSGLDQDLKNLIFTRTIELDVYGLGQQFREADKGVSDIDWDGRVREGGPFGNIMAGFNGGATGNTQFPIAYAVNGATRDNYAVFLDNTRRHRWDFTSPSQWQVEASGDALRFYLLTGPDLLDLRKDFMGLVGRPLVPPRRMFGLWISEYGYDDWAELDAKLTTLRANRFPVDGFVLDLQWFGGIPSVTGQCRMGSLTFDSATFPDAAGRIATLGDDHAVAVMLIEEAYVCDTLAEHQTLTGQSCLVRQSAAGPAPVRMCGFWGCGGMIDYTSDACSTFWHDHRRQALVDAGVVGHWTDLGEPEIFDPAGIYAVGAHRDAHNIFNFRWIRGIHAGYARNAVERRPFMMSRSGTAGIQRFGAAMWSGDISSRLSSLATHAGNQMHMSFSGIDYYGADIGGFHRNLEGDLGEMYTQWFGYGMMLDIPGRPHVENLCNCKETAPDRIGDFASNLANARQRYALIPYVYSLAHHAHRTGEPVMPPPIVFHQTDDNVRAMGHQKFIGRDLLAAIVARHGETERDVYLPQGGWFDWHTNRRIASAGEWIARVPAFRDGTFRLPLYARAGAIVPLMDVDETTLDAFGRRTGGATSTALRARVFPADTAAETAFTLFEDDGETTLYLAGAVRTTVLRQARTDDGVVVTVDPAAGTYAAAPATRDAFIEVVTSQPVLGVLLNGVDLPQVASAAALAAATNGWFVDGRGLVVARSGDMAVSETRAFAFRLGAGGGCESRHSVVSVPGAGNGWNPADPARALTCTTLRRWEGTVDMGLEPYKFAADGAWTVNWGSDGGQDGPNFPALAEAGRYAVVFDEDDAANPGFTRVGSSPSFSARFVCENGHTVFGTSVYVVGSLPQLGEWQPERAVLLSADGPYPTWTGTIGGLPPGMTIEWKCIKRLEGGDRRVEMWEPGDNNVVDPARFEQVGRF